MNRKVLLTVFAVTFVLLTTPFFGTVIAVSPKMIPVTVEDYGIGFGVPYFDIWFTPGGVAHLEMIWVGEMSLLGVSADSIEFCYEIFIKGGGPDPSRGVYQVREVWTNKAGTGWFEGIAHWDMTAPELTQFTSHIVLQGHGEYEGWTLLLSGDYGFGNEPQVYSGSLLIL
jgi:hypothetical protein